MTEMKTIFEQAMAAAEAGERVYVNLQQRSLRINDTYLIKDGKHEGELGIDISDDLESLAPLYAAYKHSVPSERSESRRSYFRALPEKDLSDEDMMYGTPRELARLQLELNVLAVAISGKLKWTPEMGSYFWKSKRDHDFVILRQWIDTETN